MRQEILFEMKSPYRDDFRIHGYWFGEGKETLAIVGAMRGDEIQQQFIGAQLVNTLKELEKKGELTAGHSILVIPSCNPFSMNVNRRFWTMDGTDINRMFPGYNLGETTQRIAAELFKRLQNFEYGIQLASFYMPGEFVPHVRMLKTGFEDVEGAKLFGFPYVTVRRPKPFDTTLLNYNWQIWETKAYSVYAGETNFVDSKTSTQTVDAILRFLNKKGVANCRVHGASYESAFLDEDDFLIVKASRAGIFMRLAQANDIVKHGETIAKILDPYDGHILEEVKAPSTGRIFFVSNRPLVLQYAPIYKIEQFDE